MSLDEIPMFIKNNSIIPLAKPVEFVSPSTVFDVTCNVYGNPTTSFSLFADNSFTNDFSQGNYSLLNVNWKGNKGSVDVKGNYKNQLYKIVGWKQVTGSL